VDSNASKFHIARTVGFWLAILMAVLQGVNTVRVVLDPTGFATYIGIPLGLAEQVNWVQIYGLRTAFISILITVLLIRKDLATLRWIALAALIMPFGDAWITHDIGAPLSIVGRHLAIAGFLIMTAFFLDRGARRQRQQGAVV
jgi:hypothetical protein